MDLLKQIAQQSQHVDDTPTIVSENDDELLNNAVSAAKLKLKVNEADEPVDSSPDSDKGLYGGRQVEFKQDVYRIPQTPSGDVSQPVGILTMQDLNNYILFKKGDRLNFKWTGGTSGQSTYDAVRNGDVSVDADIKWTDPLIRELEDEGALTLLSS